MKRLAKFKPVWIEEPTSPDDVLGRLMGIVTCLFPPEPGQASCAVFHSLLLTIKNVLTCQCLCTIILYTILYH